MWGERPIALDKEALRRRIYAPAAYAPVRNTAVVPVAHSEAYRLAAWFPLMWRRRGSELEFVAVRSLLDDQGAQPPAARAVLPLILHAYPFVFDPKAPPEVGAERMLDDVFGDAPTDAGASITNAAGRLSRATIERFRILDGLAGEFRLTREIAQALAGLDLFAPAALKFDIQGRSLELADLFVVRQDAFDSGVFSSMLEKFGAPAALVLGLHRVSLFRAGLLLAMARKALGQTSPNLPIGKPSIGKSSIGESSIGESSIGESSIGKPSGHKCSR
jgi:hypothetical protein